ncbi:p21-activated protein kinase [Ceraceosorus bombacis]|uniref:p21-activated protein kinase n=1 Tax=Ceraceosorus bombacis TaxID=401625 RepID=A0A0P1BTI7_9BASI|nr:p21-activated protein kinase [Ceraceosorus bombacis]
MYTGRYSATSVTSGRGESSASALFPSQRKAGSHSTRPQTASSIESRWTNGSGTHNRGYSPMSTDVDEDSSSASIRHAHRSQHANTLSPVDRRGSWDTSSRLSDEASSSRAANSPGLDPRRERELPPLPPPNDDDDDDPRDRNNAALYSSQDSTIISQDRFGNPTFQKRGKVAMRAAGQEAMKMGAGLRKLAGKAGAASVASAQRWRTHSRPDQPPSSLATTEKTTSRSGSGGGGGISSGLRRLNGLASKSAVDLTWSEQRNKARNRSAQKTIEVPEWDASLPLFRDDAGISLPTNVKHNVHVDVGPMGYTGLPASWADTLAQCGMDAEDVRADPKGAADLIRKHTAYYVQQEAQRGQAPETTRELLRSRLGDYEDLHSAISTPETEEWDQSPADRQAAGSRTSNNDVRQSVSTTYSSVLNRGWATSPSWDDAPSMPSSPNNRIESLRQSSPLLPEVGSDEDWGANLIGALPRGQDAKLRSRSGNSIKSSAQTTAPQRQIFAANAPTRPLGGNALTVSPEDDVKNAQISTASKALTGKPRALRMSELASRRDASRPGTGQSSRPGTADTQRAASSADHGIAASEAHAGSDSSHSQTSSWLHFSQNGGKVLQVPQSAEAQPRSAPASAAARTIAPSISPALLAASGGRNGYQAHVAPLKGSNFTLRNLNATRSTPSLHQGSVASSPPPPLPVSAAAEGFYVPKSAGIRASGASRVSNGSSAHSEAVIGPALVERRQQSGQWSSARTRSRAGSLASSVEASHSDSQYSAEPAGQPQSLRERRGAGSRIHPPSASKRTSNGLVSSDDQQSPSPVSLRFTRPDGGAEALRLNAVETKPDLSTGSGWLVFPGQGPKSPHTPLSARSRQGSKSSTSSDTRKFPVESAPVVNPTRGSRRSSKADSADHPPVLPPKDSSAPSTPQRSPAFAPQDRSVAAEADLTNGLGERSTAQRSPVTPLRSREPPPSSWGTTGSRPSGSAHVPKLSVNLRSGKLGGDASDRQSRGFLDDWLFRGLGDASSTSAAQNLNSAEPAETRIRSLPPVSHDDTAAHVSGAFESDNEGPETGEGTLGRRASISSLPETEAGFDAMRSRAASPWGPPAADQEALDAAAATRPSSRTSRPGSRASQSSRSGRHGSRRYAGRRSEDAKRFPMSTHYASGVFEHEGFSLDAEGTSTFADLMRQRRSFDLDDMMPIQLASSDPVPPVPRLDADKDKYSRRSRMTSKDELSDSPANMTKVLPELEVEAEEKDVSVRASLTTSSPGPDMYAWLPAAVRHLGPFLRGDNTSTVFGELSKIGEGESGDVYSACPLRKGSGPVAIKVIRVEQSTAERDVMSRLGQLDKELALWKQSGHANVLGLHDVYYSADGVAPGIWVAQDLMSMSLADIIALRPAGIELSESSMSRIVLDVSSALDFLHSRNIVHRDVRSDNIHLDAEGIAKLADFTHAAQLAQSPSPLSKRTSVIGTAYWMAPEVVKAEPYDTCADIWSLGVVIYEMIEGDPPRVDFPALRAITLTAKLGLPPLTSPEKWSAALQQVLSWCTEMNPSNRPTAGALAPSEFLSKACHPAQLAALITTAQAVEADAAAEEELVTSDDADDTMDLIDAHLHDRTRDSWASQSTIQG